MRHVGVAFQESTLRRGKSLEQFLGGGYNGSERTVKWVELRPVLQGIEVWRFEVPDLGDLGFTDIYEFGSNDTDEPIAVVGSPGEALALAHSQLGASQECWVNVTVVGDEYFDYVSAGRVQNWRAVRV